MSYVSRIRLRNWMPFRGEHDLSDLPFGSIAVVARYTEDPRRSNWGGKTALLEAIRFALTGRHRKRIDDALITRGEDDLLVELTLTPEYLGIDPVVVRRERPRGGPTLLTVIASGVLSERDAAEEALARILRLSPDDFERTTWFGQGDIEAMVGQTSGARREVVSRWLELDLWERLGKIAAQRASDVVDTLANMRAPSPEPIPRASDTIRDEIAKAEHRQAHDEMLLDVVEIRIEECKMAARISAMKLELQAAASAARTIRSELAALPRPDTEIGETRRVLEDARAELVAARKAKDAAAEGLRGNFDGICPVIGEACPVASQIASRRDAFSSRFSVIAEEHNDLSNLVASCVASLQQYDVGEARRAQLVGRFNEAATRVRDVKARLDTAIASLPQELHPESHDELAANERKIREEMGDRAERLGGLRYELRSSESFAVRQADRTSKTVKLERSARVSSLAARALGPSGIPARIARESLRGLEQRANGLLSGSGLSFVLAWERELQEPAPSCYECGHQYEKRKRDKTCPACSTPRGRRRSDELDILVDDGSGEIEDVRAKSGGAKVLVASAIRLAGGMMLRERRGSSLQVAVVDEPFGALDTKNREELARTFAVLLGSVGLEQAFVVSHDAALLEALPARIVVTREGSSSRLSVEV